MFKAAQLVRAVQMMVVNGGVTPRSVDCQACSCPFLNAWLLASSAELNVTITVCFIACHSVPAVCCIICYTVSQFPTLSITECPLT
jgi:hypothetical protein